MINILNLIFSTLVIIFSIYMFDKIFCEYKRIQKMKNGRRLLNIVLLLSFVENVIDSMLVVIFTLSNIFGSGFLDNFELYLMISGFIRFLILSGYIYVSKDH